MAMAKPLTRHRTTMAKRTEGAEAVIRFLQQRPPHLHAL